jgi:peptidase E
MTTISSPTNLHPSNEPLFLGTYRYVRLDGLQNGKDAINKWKPHFIYVQGGNTFWLYHCIEKGDWTQDLRNACTGENAAVYCGTSAGAIIMGDSMETACWKVRG